MPTGISPHYDARTLCRRRTGHGRQGQLRLIRLDQEAPQGDSEPPCGLFIGRGGGADEGFTVWTLKTGKMHPIYYSSVDAAVKACLESE